MGGDTAGSFTPYTTLGRLTNRHLDGASNVLVWPSTLTYKERLSLRAQNPTEYNRVYGQTERYAKDNVHERLDRDAHVRMSLPCNESKYKSPSSLPGFTTGSGWKSNWKWEEIYGPHKPQRVVDPSLLGLHPIQLHRYQKKHGVDFMVAARPQAETTSQTMRVLASYPGDKAVAKKMHMRMGPGYYAGFQPDIKGVKREFPKGATL